jgi:cobalt/nickel transport system permease protein
VHLPEVDRYAHLDSPLHRWDARVKIACVSLLTLAAVLAPTPPAALAGLAVALCLLALSRIPLSFALVHLRWVLLFCAFLLVVLPLSAGGRPSEQLWRIGPVGFSGVGLARAGLISVRALAAVLLVFVVMGTARFHVTLKALRRLHVPSVAVQILAFSYRYLFVLFDEMHRMMSAAAARGQERARGLRRLRNLGSMLGMLLVRSLDRTGRVQHAMLARGYRGEVRTLDDFRLRPGDLLKGACALATAAGLLALGARA